MKKKVVIIFTGGTISMRIDPDLHAAIPALNSSEIISTVHNIEDIADVEVINFSNIPSPHMEIDMMMELSFLAEKHISRDDVSGLIITHGTDTLEETAYLLDLRINSSKPIIFVGAMRNNSELGYDGASNLAAAICTATSENALNKGVLVVMNNEVIAASEVTKSNTLSLNTFKSPEFGPLGIVDSGEVIFYRDIIKRKFIDTKKIQTKVALIKTVPGMDNDIIDFYITSGYRGIVIEGMGRGNIPPNMVSGVKKALSLNIPVVLVSRCYSGRVLDSYGYEGGGKELTNLGVILGGHLPVQKARIKLMLLLGYTEDMGLLKDLFEKNIF